MGEEEEASLQTIKVKTRSRVSEVMEAVLVADRAEGTVARPKIREINKQIIRDQESHPTIKGKIQSRVTGVLEVEVLLVLDIQ